MNLLTIRKKINIIDEKIVEPLTKRQACSIDVAVYKKKHNLSINQKDREMLIFENLKNISKEKGLSFELVEDIFKVIFKYSKKTQR